MVPTFELNSVEKYYGQRLALVVYELALAPGRFYLLTGANGSGKSTLLNLLALLLRPDVGELKVHGETVTWKAAQVAQLRTKITLLHQSPFLFSGNVLSNVAYGLKMRRMARSEAEGRVSSALRQVGLSGFEKRNVRQLSGGEARRVAVARALAIAPEVMLLDEPFANLDRASAEILEEVVTALPATGTTVVMSSHDAQHVERIACDVLHVNEGRLEAAALQRNGRETSRNKETQLCPPLTSPAT